MEKTYMRDLHFEAAIWNLFTSTEFFEGASRECEETMKWFGTLAVSRQTANFGRNNQIYDTFKSLARDFRRGAELARLNDYELVWDIARSVPGDVRGIMEQPLHSWMTESEYQEFSHVRISRLLSYANQITHALNNAIVKGETFFHPNPSCPERRNDDDGFPGGGIVEIYQSYVNWYKKPLFWTLPDPLPEYVVDKSMGCRTGDEVPWTGVWYPATGLERHSLTFAIKGLRMQPAFQVIKTTEELRTEDSMFPSPETIAVATTWHPVIPTGRTVGTDAPQELRAKAGQPCPKAGIWQPMDPGAAARRYEVNEPMANLGSAYGITVWQWMADR
jgi:hypothetical protein